MAATTIVKSILGFWARLYHIFTPVFVRRTRLIVAAWQTEIFLHSNSLRIVFPISSDGLKQLLQRI